MITSVMLVLTLIALGLGAFFGFIRGRNRAVLRLILVAASMLIAILMRNSITDAVMGINLGEQSVKDAMLAAFNQGEMALPSSIQDLIFGLIAIFIGIFAYFMVFFALRAFTWILVFPICKIFVKKETYITRGMAKAIKQAQELQAKEEKAEAIEKQTQAVEDTVAEDNAEQTQVVEDAAQEVKQENEPEKKKFKFKLPGMYNNTKMKRGTGALVGLVQGVLIVFALIMPLNGMIVQANKITSLELQGQKLLELPADLGLEEYVNGGLGKTYNALGGWYFNMLTSADKINFDDVTDMVVVVGGIADSITGITESMDVLQKEDATTLEKTEALTDVGNKLIQVGASIDSLSDDAKQQIDNMLSDVKDLIGGSSEGDGETSEIEEFFNDLSIDDIDIAGMGHALIGASSIMEKQETGEAINQEDINHIVTGLATNMKIVDMIMGEDETPTLVDNLDEDQKEMFENAIAQTELSAENEQTLRKLLGLLD